MGSLSHVGIAASGIERVSAVTVVRPQETVNLGHMNPSDQVRVGGHIGPTVRGGPADTLVYGPHDGNRAVGVRDRAECGLGQKSTGAL